MTVVTYQGLHAACNNWGVSEEETESEEEEGEDENGSSTNENLDQIVTGLKTQNIGTIVVDESHHLKNEWWHTLTKVKTKLDPIVVGLTATPPYDVTGTEWQRYAELNGPVDTEITVPELVIEGDLCLHQDYVHFTVPTEEENQSIQDFRKNIEALFLEIKQDETICNALVSHPIWQNPTEHLDWIYNNLAYYSACLIFLNASEKEIPKTHLEVIGDKNFKIPKLDYAWTETVLDFYLYREKDHFKEFNEHRKKLENRLRRGGAIERRQINFSQNKRLTGFLTSSISKLNSIREIVDFEHKHLGSNLRLVVLSDYIRKEFFINAPENKVELTKMGVVPIFEKLRRESQGLKKIGVLTGSMILIPSSALVAFETCARQLGISRINSSPVPYDNDYLEIRSNAEIKNDIIHIVTTIFQAGEIEVLIGTKSLLGEGWDAPAINSLILATFVGSFVLSNQMRGRAIRKQNGNTEKTGNIWHLATIDETSPNGGADFDLMKRRFRSFVGVSFKEEPGIENGIGRLNLPENIHLKEEAEKKNRETFLYAADRDGLKKRWELGLKSGVTLVEEIKIPFPEERAYKATKSMYLNKTIGNLIATLGFGIMTFGMESLQALGRMAKHIKSVNDFYSFLSVIGLAGILVFGRLAFKTIRLFIKYRDISKDIQRIGEALLHALIQAGTIHTEYAKLQVATSVEAWCSVFCHLEGGSTFDKSTFILALQEIIAPIDNPRYVLIRKNSFMLFMKQKDYHSVPEIIGKNKILAEYFRNQWERLVGSCELVFTRTIEGRKLLLKSRVKSLAVQFEDKVEHVNKWRYVHP